MKNIQTKVVEKLETHISCSVTFFFSKIVYEINGKKCGRAGHATWHMRISCWILKTTDTLTICNTYCLSTATMVARTRLSVTLYVHCLSCYLITEAVSFRLELKLFVPAFSDITSCLAYVTVISTTSGSLASLGCFFWTASGTISIARKMFYKIRLDTDNWSRYVYSTGSESVEFCFTFTSSRPALLCQIHPVRQKTIQTPPAITCLLRISSCEWQ